MIMHHTKRLRYGLISVVIGSAFTLTGAIVTPAQQKDDQKPEATKQSRDSGRDPFKKYEPPRVVPRKTGLILPPSIQERIEQYRAQKAAAMNARIQAPKPTTALLLSEVQVMGISRTPRGYAAIVEAMPIKLSYVIYPGERFYDGQLVAIEDNRLVFRRETVFADGRRERSVEMKPLRQPSKIDSMASVKTAPTTAAVAEPEKKSEEKTSATEKP